MKQRIITSAVGLPILFLVIALLDTPVLNVAVAIVIMMEIDELILATGCRSYTSLRLLVLLLGGITPFLNAQLLEDYLPVFCTVFPILMFCIVIRHFGTLQAERVGFNFAMAVLIAFSTNCFVFLRDRFGIVIGLYGIFVALVGAWLSDTGAFFFGLAFGKHKLAPSISPKKTIEGAVGGVVMALVSQLLLAWLYTLYCGLRGITISIDLMQLMLLSPIISVLSIIGDLSASSIKRQFGVKDFGNIMPGHGGILDRFDSVLFVVPVVYLVFCHFPLIQVL